MRMTTDRRWLSLREGARYFDLKPRTLYILIARGQIPQEAVLRLGKQIRICPELVEAALRRGNK
jgi:excisionase family DNA binding protein